MATGNTASENGGMVTLLTVYTTYAPSLVGLILTDTNPPYSSRTLCAVSITADVSCKNFTPTKQTYPRFSITSNVIGTDRPLIYVSVSTDAITGIGLESAENSRLFYGLTLTGADECLVAKIFL